ncbi:MAG: DUF2189 domain-containing protein [Alphaproteobacteria bacterium]|nr:DUF2189 domain-containing protein [Alphaproteobacteria bacterium]
MIEPANAVQASTESSGAAPAVLPVKSGEILEILAAGLRDFRAAPLYGLTVAGIYTAGGWFLILLLLHFDLPHLIYPLAAGFALIAPFIAAAFYAVSRSLERHEPLSWGHILGSVRTAARSDLGWMALVSGFSLFIWMDIAALLFFGFLGFSALSAPELLRIVFTTPMGLLFLLIGNGVGAVIAFAVFSFSVTSYPMLFDRDVDFVTAMVTSVKVVLKNKIAMVVWCVTIAILVGLSLLSGLIGFLVILPVLGHATWHLYRRAIAPAPDTA